jgi:hypothetical protein
MRRAWLGRWLGLTFGQTGFCFPQAAIIVIELPCRRLQNGGPGPIQKKQRGLRVVLWNGLRNGIRPFSCDGMEILEDTEV